MAVTVAVISAAMAAASAVAGGIQAKQAGEAEKKASDYNAEILKRNAKQARLEGTLNEDAQRSQNRQELSSARAAMGELGMSDSQTTTGLLAQEAAIGEQNAINQRYGYETEANRYMADANLEKYYGKQAQRQGRNAFYMGLLSGASSALSSIAGAKSQNPNSSNTQTAAPKGGNVTGQGISGGNVRFTNASYRG